MPWHPNSILTVSTAIIDGDYLPDSSLSLKELDSFDELRQHINKQVGYFLDRPGYSDAMEDFSHMVIKDLKNKNKCNDTKEKEKEKVVLEMKKEEAFSKEELQSQIDTKIIGFMEEFYDHFQIDPKETYESELNTRQLILSPEDQPDNDSIVVKATGLKFHMYFNQAPNRNNWDQLDICVHYL